MNSVPITFRHLGALLMASFGLISCDGKAPVPPPQQTESEKPKWISGPKGEWPQIVLTNEAAFHGHTSLNGASGFLAKNSRGDVFYATAAHLLGANGGVDPEIAQSKLDSVLKSWVAYPRTKEDAKVTITGVAGSPSADLNNDWALLKIERPAGGFPAEPLRLRKNPVAVGETVHLIGVPYSEPNEAQKVYAGVVTARGYGDRFRFDIDPPVDIRGFSGAPIIDGDGLVVGVMTIWFDPKMDGTRFLEAGGEDAASVDGRIESGQP